MKRLVALGVLAISVAACRNAVLPGENVAGGSTIQGTEAINYVHDDKHGVGCWFYAAGSGSSSIACLPDSQIQNASE